MREPARRPLELAALILFALLWRLPTLGDPPWLNDEGVYATVGQSIMQGEALYRQVWENKPPAIYLLYGVVHLLVGPAHLLLGVRMLALLASVIIQLAVYRLACAQRGPAAALLAVALVGLLVDLPLIDGTTANAEIFVAACTGTGMVLLWRCLRAPTGHRRWPALLLGGICFGAAIMFKLVAAADLLAAFGIVVYWPAERGLRTAAPGQLVLSRLPALLALLLGAALPIGAVAGWLASRGLLSIAYYATVTYNRSYVATGQTLHGPLIAAAALTVPVLLLLAAFWLARRAVDGRSFGALACWWLALTVAGALSSGRFYLHYFVQAVPPFALALALLASTLAARRSVVATGESPDVRGVGGRSAAHGEPARRLRVWLAGLLIVWTCLVPLVSLVAVLHEPAHAAPGSDLVGYYGHVWQWLTGTLDETAFGNALDPRVERNVAVAAYLRGHPLAPRRLYVWGNVPWIYYLSRYEHAARFLSAYYNPPIPGGMAQVLSALRRQPPPYIVVIEPPTPADAALSRFISAGYRPVRRVANAVVFRRD